MEASSKKRQEFIIADSNTKKVKAQAADIRETIFEYCELYFDQVQSADTSMDDSDSQEKAEPVQNSVEPNSNNKYESDEDNDGDERATRILATALQIVRGCFANAVNRNRTNRFSGGAARSRAHRLILEDVSSALDNSYVASLRPVIGAHLSFWIEFCRIAGVDPDSCFVRDLGKNAAAIQMAEVELLLGFIAFAIRIPRNSRQRNTARYADILSHPPIFVDAPDHSLNESTAINFLLFNSVADQCVIGAFGAVGRTGIL